MFLTLTGRCSDIVPISDEFAFGLRGCTVILEAMFDEPRISKSARSPIPHAPFKWVAWMIAGAAGFAVIGGLTWADAPAILLNVAIVVLLSAVVALFLLTLLKFLQKPSPPENGPDGMWD